MIDNNQLHGADLPEWRKSLPSGRRSHPNRFAPSHVALRERYGRYLECQCRSTRFGTKRHPLWRSGLRDNALHQFSNRDSSGCFANELS